MKDGCGEVVQVEDSLGNVQNNLDSVLFCEAAHNRLIVPEEDLTLVDSFKEDLT